MKIRRSQGDSKNQFRVLGGTQSSSGRAWDAVKPAVPRGANPRSPASGILAQLIEHLTFNQVVAGSNPVGNIRFVSQVAKTPPFHGGIAGSIPARTIRQGGERRICHGLFSPGKNWLIYH